LILWIILLVILFFGCATSPFHQTPREKCLALCQDDLEVCKENCTEQVGEAEQAAPCIDQCEKTFSSCNEKCPN